MVNCMLTSREVAFPSAKDRTAHLALGDLPVGQEELLAPPVFFYFDQY